MERFSFVDSRIENLGVINIRYNFGYESIDNCRKSTGYADYVFFCNVTAFISHMTTNITETTLFSFYKLFSVINDTSFGKKDYIPG